MRKKYFLTLLLLFGGSIVASAQLVLPAMAGVIASKPVSSSGSGVTLSGLAKGYYREELKEFFPQVKKKIWTTCVSSVSSINKTLKKSGIPIPLNIRKSEYLFEDRLEGYEAPFPCNQFWDIKQWKWLEENIDQMEGTILFWNIGGIYKF